MNRQTSPSPSEPVAEEPFGVVLPSMRWTTDRQEVQREQICMFEWQERLEALLEKAEGDSRHSVWYALALAASDQLDYDIDRLFDWLEATGPEDHTRQ